MKPITALLLSALLSLCACSTPDGDPAPVREGALLRDSLPHKIGAATAGDSGAVCSVSATAPSGSATNRQQLQFYVERDDLDGRTTHRFLVATGGSRTLADVQKSLGGALRQGATAAPGAELAKIGDIKLGGELRLVARGAGKVEFAYNPALPSGNPVLSAGEAAAFAEALSR